MMLANQTWERRRPYMKRAIELDLARNPGEPYSVVEIGSWAGESAILWADAIRDHNEGVGRVVCVDPWLPYFSDTDVDRAPKLAQMEDALKNNEIYRLFLHNVRASGHERRVEPQRGKSDDVLPQLGEQEFDLVFVDGLHTYSQVIKDLHNSDRLVRQGGLLCGDDLELQDHEVDRELTRQNKEIDCILDERSNEHYHPGVTLAVSEFFGCEVSAYEGFWLMRKTASGWAKVDLG